MVRYVNPVPHNNKPSKYKCFSIAFLPFFILPIKKNMTIKKRMKYDRVLRAIIYLNFENLTVIAMAIRNKNKIGGDFSSKIAFTKLFRERKNPATKKSMDPEKTATARQR